MRGARARKLERIFLRLHERDRIGADVGFAARPLDRLGQVGRDGRGVEGDARALPAQVLDELEQASGSSTSAWRLRLLPPAAVSFLRSRNTTGRPSSGR